MLYHEWNTHYVEGEEYMYPPELILTNYDLGKILTLNSFFLYLIYLYFSTLIASLFIPWTLDLMYFIIYEYYIIADKNLFYGI
jgi:hypothetical protein